MMEDEKKKLDEWADWITGKNEPEWVTPVWALCVLAFGFVVVCSLFARLG